MGLRPIVSAWFQVLFTRLSPYFSPFSHLTDRLSVTEEYLALGGGPPGFTRSSTSSVLLWYVSQRGAFGCAYGAITRFGAPFKRFCYRYLCNPSRRPQPRDESRFGLDSRSLAATCEIVVTFFSSGYLDVSVPRVSFRRLCVQRRISSVATKEVSLFGNPRVIRLVAD